MSNEYLHSLLQEDRITPSAHGTLNGLKLPIAHIVLSGETMRLSGARAI